MAHQTIDPAPTSVAAERSAIPDPGHVTPASAPNSSEPPGPPREPDAAETDGASIAAAPRVVPSTTTTIAPAPPSTTSTSPPPATAPPEPTQPDRPAPADSDHAGDRPEQAGPAPITTEVQIVDQDAEPDAPVTEEKTSYEEANTFTSDRRAERIIRAQLAWHRFRNGLPHLWSAPSLIDEARRWSHQMATALGLRHNPDSLTYTYAHCSDCVAAAENVGRGPHPEGMLGAFLDSPSHRAQIERASRGVIGVGAYRDAEGRLYVTLMFGFYDT